MLGLLDYIVLGGGMCIAAFLLFNMIKETFFLKKDKDSMD